MNSITSYSKNRKKELGAFYSPQILSDYLASTVFSLYKGDTKKEGLNIVDPATGDSILLHSMAKIAKRKGLRYKLIGLDIDPMAIMSSEKTFEKTDINCIFVNTDALYPLNAEKTSKGWKDLINKYISGGIHFFVSNPPWGADISKYSELHDDFEMAEGQFDIYDLFIETMINHLDEDGIYGIIVPDSIYCKEHTPIREKLFNETTIKKIIRIGEGFFQDVNMAVSLIFGVKKRSKNYKIKCSHLSNKEKKMVLSGNKQLRDIVKSSQIHVPSKIMIENGYSFITDIDNKDVSLFRLLSNTHHFADYCESLRGVELSKKGNVICCPHCNRWLPEPRWKNYKKSFCPHCGIALDKSIKTTKIINKGANGNGVPLIVGEDITRYITKSKRTIILNYDGINYKSADLYNGSKILVRKTGIGITAGIDYNNCYVNQVVYILKRKRNINPAISNEVILAVLNSRLITYYFIKKYGGTGWKSNPYISQEMISGIPFPLVNIEDDFKTALLNRLTILVREGTENMNIDFPPAKDAEIERIVAALFDVKKDYYKVIFDTLNSVEQLIPFKRLLNITIEDIFKYGV